MDLSVVIINWNTKELLITCLDSLFSGGLISEEQVWVVDNASSDGSAEAIEKYFPNINLIITPENVGFGAANNLAILHINKKYVWFLNPDTEVRSAALTTLINFMESNPSAGAAGSKFLNPDGSLQTSCYPFPTVSRECWRLLHLDTIWTYGGYNQAHWNPNEVREVDVLQGASLILRKEVLDQVGLFDEDYFMYTEEVDLCFRVKNAGWHLFWVPQSEVIHYGGQSTQQAATEMFISLYQTKLLFFKKHYSWFDVQLYKLVLSIASIVRLLLTPFALVMLHVDREKQLTLAKNYQRLLQDLWKN
jgi:GT2 family glycosyltransferase